MDAAVEALVAVMMTRAKDGEATTDCMRHYDVLGVNRCYTPKSHPGPGRTYTTAGSLAEHSRCPGSIGSCAVSPLFKAQRSERRVDDRTGFEGMCLIKVAYSTRLAKRVHAETHAGHAECGSHPSQVMR